MLNVENEQYSGLSSDGKYQTSKGNKKDNCIIPEFEYTKWLLCVANISSAALFRSMDWMRYH